MGKRLWSRRCEDQWSKIYQDQASRQTDSDRRTGYRLLPRSLYKGWRFHPCRTTANRPSGYFCQGKKSSPTALISAMNKIFPQIYTSLSTSDILSLMKYLPFYEIGDQQGFPYKLSCHRGRDGIYYDFPTTLVSNVKKLHKELFGTDNYEPSKLVHTISKETSN